MANKNQIIKQLKDAKVDHDPNADIEVLAKLLEAHVAKNAPVKAETSGGGIVQLTRNAAGHQMGETFKEADAEKLGITEDCQPFDPNAK